VTNQYVKRTGSAPVRTFSIVLGAVATLVAAPLLSPSAAHASGLALAYPNGQSVEDFYTLRSERPLWFEAGHPTAAAQALIWLLNSAKTDGLDPGKYKIDEIREAMQRASNGKDGAVRKADLLLSNAFTAYARDLRATRPADVQYVDPALYVGPPSPLRLLQDAARASSLKDYVANLGWMNPDYVALRRALVSGNYDGEKQRDLLRINLDRARILPADSPRYIVVNTATQRLYMYDGGKLADSMKVVVGQTSDDRKTPPMAGYLHYAALNPYWNVPPDLVWDDVGIFVEKYGLNYLKTRGYQVLSDWGDNPTVVDPATVDWEAVKTGKIQIRVRQLPGPENFLGKVKYTFSNPFGVYLHDTIRRELLDKDTRLYSGGCIRLEDAARLGRWLFGHDLQATSEDPEQLVKLERPVPVYVTYMTAVPSGSSITYLDDVYGWDAKRLATFSSGGDSVTAARWSAALPVRIPGDLLSDRPAIRVERRAEADILLGKLTHQRIRLRASA
jgi:L,D-transpeptidase YcbB